MTSTRASTATATFAAPTVPDLDVRTYVDSFESSIVPAYRRGVADDEWPAESGMARSILPPGTAAVRDFSHLSPRLPQFLAERCVGCMACVSACPDAALLANVVPQADLPGAIEAFVSTEAARTASAGDAQGSMDGTAAADELASHFARTKKYADVPERNGVAPGSFGLFVDAAHCKGCAECVEVCVNLGHDALFMTDKLEATDRRPSTIDAAARDVRFLRSLPPTPAIYRNEKALADLMLGEQAYGYVGGAGSCAGCGEGTSIRMMVAATRELHGAESMGIVAATGCNTVFG